jgi:branched-chain amino acid transport system ATP-binding protein
VRRAALLELNDIEVYYGKVRALKGVSLRVEKGRIFSVLGANGAGKTTLLSAVMGLIHPAKGGIRLDGADVSRKEPHQRVPLGIALVPEGRRIFPDFSVEENLRMGAYQRRDRQGIEADLERIYRLFPILRERKRQRSKTLSGGEAQMLALGRAIMLRPRLLLLDEPSMGLMPAAIAEIFKVVKRLPEEGVTVLLVEQNVKKALEISDEAAVLELGAIALSGRAKDLVENPRVREAYLGG